MTASRAGNFDVRNPAKEAIRLTPRATTTKSPADVEDSGPRNQSDAISGESSCQTSHRNGAHYEVHGQSRHNEIGGTNLGSVHPVYKTLENQRHLSLQPTPGMPRMANPFFDAIAVDHPGIGNPCQLQSPIYPRDHPASSGMPSMVSQMPTHGTITPVEPATGGNPTRLPSMTSQEPVHGSPSMRPVPLETALSPVSGISASTTPSRVKNLVADSKFHDDVLCQLLDAARLNLIGEEAKKALNRAARARVIELRDMKEKVS